MSRRARELLAGMIRSPYSLPMASKLKQLLIKEVSGVDRPANMLDGWLVMKAADAPDAQSTLAERLKTRLGRGTTEGKDIDVTPEELNGALDARFASFETSLVESLSKAVAPAAVEEPAPATKSAEEIAAEVEAANAATVEALTKAVEEAIQPVLEVLDKALDRIAGCEGALGMVARKSLEGQEGDESAAAATEATPTLKDAIGAALKGRTVIVR